MVQISATPHRPPEVMLSLVNYLGSVEQETGQQDLFGLYKTLAKSDKTVKVVE